jgi:DNA-3-methyladenine glycosylase
MSLPRAWRRLGADFYAHDTIAVARALIGTILVQRNGAEVCAGRVVETEAYLGELDEASHSFRGRTPRNAAMFGPAGRAYVYRSYGVHSCFNVVTGRAGMGEAVLVRALEPLLGIDAMKTRRGTDVERDLCRGPGRLTVALGVSLEHDGVSLVRGPLGLWSDGVCFDAAAIGTTPRIGITRSSTLALRFVARGSRYVSGRALARR